MTGQADVSLPAVLRSHPVDPTEPIETLEQLLNHLHQAAYLEMSTIPMYLYAGFSIETRGYSQWDPGVGASRLIRSIVVEEMLHLTLVRNLLVALGDGGNVTFYDQGFLPRYPSLMLHRWPPLELHLGRCTTEQVRDVFMEFERPKPNPWDIPPPEGWYSTIGELYRAVEDGLRRLDQNMGPKLWANNQPDVQYVAAYWNKDGGGEPLLVHDLQSALDALKTIVEQGEGMEPGTPSVPIDPVHPKAGLDELPHYTKFQRIAEGIEGIGTVRSLPTDPHAPDYAGDAGLTALNSLFNAVYCYVLHMLDVIFRTSWKDLKAGESNLRYHLERSFISVMQGVLVTLAETMAAVPAGPTFEHWPLPERGRKAHLVELCDKAMASFPRLGGDNSVRWLLGKLPDV
ncbi:ferritin-like protein [Streptomyces sp. SCA3-4]|uniref:ferritin-like domain-containing protein n=1 Tax=Streptomyces sichuanensis TaxID=2871810 RepID=UPI001CE33F45|nr:ferritin-like protein [Streptomyces sichuanensis]MCA6091099.1 ferritin-like protein [Streptomyces sichuanensis]